MRQARNLAEPQNRSPQGSRPCFSYLIFFTYGRIQASKCSPVQYSKVNNMCTCNILHCVYIHVRTVLMIINWFLKIHHNIIHTPNAGVQSSWPYTFKRITTVEDVNLTAISNNEKNMLTKFRSLGRIFHFSLHFICLKMIYK